MASHNYSQYPLQNQNYLNQQDPQKFNLMNPNFSQNQQQAQKLPNFNKFQQLNQNTNPLQPSQSQSFNSQPQPQPPKFYPQQPNLLSTYPPTSQSQPYYPQKQTNNYYQQQQQQQPPNFLSQNSFNNNNLQQSGLKTNDLLTNLNLVQNNKSNNGAGSTLPQGDSGNGSASFQYTLFKQPSEELLLQKRKVSLDKNVSDLELLNKKIKNNVPAAEPPANPQQTFLNEAQKIYQQFYEKLDPMEEEHSNYAVFLQTQLPVSREIDELVKILLNSFLFKNNQPIFSTQIASQKEISDVINPKPCFLNLQCFQELSQSYVYQLDLFEHRLDKSSNENQDDEVKQEEEETEGKIDEEKKQKNKSQKEQQEQEKSENYTQILNRCINLDHIKNSENLQQQQQQSEMTNIEQKFQDNLQKLQQKINSSSKRLQFIQYKHDQAQTQSQFANTLFEYVNNEFKL